MNSQGDLKDKDFLQGNRKEMMTWPKVPLPLPGFRDNLEYTDKRQRHTASKKDITVCVVITFFLFSWYLQNFPAEDGFTENNSKNQ